MHIYWPTEVYAKIENRFLENGYTDLSDYATQNKVWIFSLEIQYTPYNYYITYTLLINLIGYLSLFRSFLGGKIRVFKTEIKSFIDYINVSGKFLPLSKKRNWYVHPHEFTIHLPILLYLIFIIIYERTLPPLWILDSLAIYGISL